METIPIAHDDYNAALQGAAFFESPDLGILRVTGQDRAAWLHKLITANVQALAPGTGARSALLEAKGHLVSIFTILAGTDEFLLIGERAALGLLAASLRRYIFREKVQVTDATSEWSLFSVAGLYAAEQVGILCACSVPTVAWSWVRGAFEDHEAFLVNAPLLSVPSVWLLAPSTQRDALERELASHIPVRLSPDTVEVLRLEAGTPRWGVDVDEATLALEAPVGLQVRVDQGCYVGQEVVARIVHRGHVNRRLTGLVLSPGDVVPARGDAVLDGEREVGTVTSAALSPRRGAIALGYVRRETLQDPHSITVRGAREWQAEIVESPLDTA